LVAGHPIRPHSDRGNQIRERTSVSLARAFQRIPFVHWSPVMGASVKNVEAVTDFADNRHFIRLHRDILLPAEACEAVRRLLAAGRWDEAKSISLEHAPEDAHAEIELFFTVTAERLASVDLMDAEPVSHTNGHS
jgi:hypothetical protein